MYRQTGVNMARKSNLDPQLPRWTIYIDQINWIMAQNALSTFCCVPIPYETLHCAFVISRNTNTTMMLAKYE